MNTKTTTRQQHSHQPHPTNTDIMKPTSVPQGNYNYSTAAPSMPNQHASSSQAQYPSSSNAQYPSSSNAQRRPRSSSDAMRQQQLQANYSGRPQKQPVPYISSNEKSLAQEVYKANRYYQGTDKVNGDERRAYGMDPARKTASSVDNGLALGYVQIKPKKVERFRRTAMSHYYFTKLKNTPPGSSSMGATDYAKLASATNGTPKLLRTFLPEGGAVSLHTDPDSPPDSQAFRTSSVVPPGSVLRSKHARVKITNASEDFKNEYNKVPFRPMLGLPELDSARAAYILDDVQSDSDDDQF